MLNDFADFFKAFIAGNFSPFKNAPLDHPQHSHKTFFAESTYLFKALIVSLSLRDDKALLPAI
jgi:hypothetical protein